MSRNTEFPNIPEDCNLRDYLDGYSDEAGDGLADLLSFAREYLEENEHMFTEEDYGNRMYHLEWAESEFNEYRREDKVWEPLRAAFVDWPEPEYSSAYAMR